MKMPRLVTSIVVLFGVTTSVAAAAAIPECDSGQQRAMSKTFGFGYGDQLSCTKATGWEPSTSSLPATSILAKVCLNSNCLGVVTMIEGIIPTDCILSGVAIRSQWIEPFKASCAALVTTSPPATPAPTSAPATPPPATPAPTSAPTTAAPTVTPSPPQATTSPPATPSPTTSAPTPSNSSSNSTSGNIPDMILPPLPAPWQTPPPATPTVSTHAESSGDTRTIATCLAASLVVATVILC